MYDLRVYSTKCISTCKNEPGLRLPGQTLHIIIRLDQIRGLFLQWHLYLYFTCTITFLVCSLKHVHLHTKTWKGKTYIKRQFKNYKHVRIFYVLKCTYIKVTIISCAVAMIVFMGSLHWGIIRGWFSSTSTRSWKKKLLFSLFSIGEKTRNL